MQLNESNFEQKIEQVTETALATGALQPIETEARWMSQDGFDFMVRYISSLAHKQRAMPPAHPNADPNNPFLPYEPAMYVGDLCPTHACLLNKFNVVDNHVLMVTKSYEPQSHLLTVADMQAALTTLSFRDGLVFYNGGVEAGASQHHKHLQMIPLPMAPEVRIPLWCGTPDTVVPNWPFAHSLFPVNEDMSATTLHQQYLEAMDSFGLLQRDSELAQGPYNFLVTRQWAWLVPRKSEGQGGISLNSLAFAGALLVKSPDLLPEVERLGPMNLLVQCAGTV